MANVRELVPFILRWEGGYCNDPDDLGQETNKGVCFRTYKLYKSRKGLPQPTIEDLKNISDNEFTDILKSMYWDACRADRIESQSVANAIVDWGWHSGTITAAKEIQKLLGVTADGIIGNITLCEINSRNPRELFDAIKIARIAYLNRICSSRPANTKFMRGWLNRVNSLEFND